MPIGVGPEDHPLLRVVHGEAAVEQLGASGDVVAWCQSSCAQLHLTAASAGERVIPVPRGASTFESEATFSPDGHLVAILAGDPAGAGVVVLAVARTGTIRWVGRESMPGGAALAWSPDGTRLFAAWPSLSHLDTSVIEYHAGSNRAELATLPIAPDRPAMLAVSKTSAPSLHTAQLGFPETCHTPPATGTGVCGFRF